jgi:hypothetical protein
LYNINVLNLHASTKDRSDDIKDSFYDELQHVFNQFPMQHMKILLRDFNEKVWTEDILKMTMSLH